MSHDRSEIHVGATVLFFGVNAPNDFVYVFCEKEEIETTEKNVFFHQTIVCRVA